MILFLRTATPPTSSDELIYHLPVPALFVEQGKVSALYDNSLGNMPLLVHMIYAVCLLARSDIAARLFSLFVAIATAFALYAFCARLLSRRTGVIALFAFFGAGMVVEVSVTTRIDVALAGMLFMSTYAMFNSFTTGRKTWLWLSALLGGFALGIKHSAAVWLFALALMYLVEKLLVSRERKLEVVKNGVLYAFIAFALASPWYLKNYVWFRNPIYPLVTGEVASFDPGNIRYFTAADNQKLDAHFAEARKQIPQVVAEQENMLSQVVQNRPARHPLLLWEYFTRPNTYLMAEPYHFPNYLFLFIPFAVFVTRNKYVWMLLSISVLYIFVVAWNSWIARMLLPAYPALTIVAAYVLSSFGESKRSLKRSLVFVAIALALSVPIGVSLAWIRQLGTVQFVLGRVSREEFLGQFPYYRPISFINSELPVEARIFILGAQLNYGIRREYTSDETWFATKWRRLLVRNDSLASVHDDLKREGFTHVLYSPEIFREAALMGIDGAGGMDLIMPRSEGISAEHQLLRNWATFTLFKQQFLEPVYSDENGFEVLKIR